MNEVRNELNSLTVAHLLDVVSRAHSVISESDGAEEHHELLGDLSAVTALCQYAIDVSHMGSAAHVAILARGDE